MTCWDCENSQEHTCMADMMTNVLYKNGYDVIMRYFTQDWRGSEFRNLGTLCTDVGDFTVTYEKPNMYITYAIQNKPKLFKQVTDKLHMKRYSIDNLHIGVKTYDIRNKNTVGNIMRLFSKLSKTFKCQECKQQMAYKRWSVCFNCDDIRRME